MIKVLQEINHKNKINLDSIKGLSIEEQELLIELFNSELVKESLSFAQTIDLEKSWLLLKKKLIK